MTDNLHPLAGQMVALSRYYFDFDPVATAGYVHAYREMRDMPDEVVLGAGV